MITNRITTIDTVKTSIADPDGTTVYTLTQDGYRNVAQAIANTYAHFTHNPRAYVPGHASESLERNPSFFHYYRNPEADANAIEDYVFTVNNLTTGATARYRVNAGGHVRLIVEEHQPA